MVRFKYKRRPRIQFNKFHQISDDLTLSNFSLDHTHTNFFLVGTSDILRNGKKYAYSPIHENKLESVRRDLHTKSVGTRSLLGSSTSWTSY